MSLFVQPGLMPFRNCACQAVSPIAPLGPMATLPPGPVDARPHISALATLSELVMVELVAISPISRRLVTSYCPPVLYEVLDESKLSDQTLLPLRSIWSLATMACVHMPSLRVVTRTLRPE